MAMSASGHSVRIFIKHLSNHFDGKLIRLHNPAIISGYLNVFTTKFSNSGHGGVMTARVIKNYINGKWVASKSGRNQQIHNPATGEVLAEVGLTSAAEVDKAVKAAREAFHEWRTTP